MNSDTDHPIGRFVTAYWAELSPGARPHLAGRGDVQGVLIVKPPFNELMFAEGVWDEINEACGVNLDWAEEEDLSVDQVAGAADVVSAVSERMAGSSRRLIRHQIGEAEWPIGSGPRPVTEEMSVVEFTAELERLERFLRKAFGARKRVVVEL